MKFIIDTEVFEKIISEVVRLANICYNSNNYDIDNVEISFMLSDYDDGNGPQLVSRAALRNPEKDEYNIIIDVMDSPKEALDCLFSKLKDEIGESFDLKYKSYHYNNKLN